MTGCTSFKRLERLGSEEKAGQNTRCSLNPQNRASVPLLVLLQKEKAVKRSKRKGEWENEGRGRPLTFFNTSLKYFTCSSVPSIFCQKNRNFSFKK